MDVCVEQFILRKSKELPPQGASFLIVPYLVPREHYPLFLNSVDRYTRMVATIYTPQVEVSLDGKRIRIYSLVLSAPPVYEGF
jgi:hypothetical protein